jgi:chorismate synthase
VNPTARDRLRDRRLPAGMELSEADIQPDLDRRKPGTSRHVTQRHEDDKVEILSGVYEGKTTGTPIALLIRNVDQRSKDYDKMVQLADTRSVWARLQPSEWRSILRSYMHRVPRR